MVEYGSVKIPVFAYQGVNLARQELFRRGLDSLPKEIREPDHCPNCRSKLERFEAVTRFIACSNCSLQIPYFNTTSNMSLGRGVVIGLGLLALLYLLSAVDENR